jgi:peptide/nickel transport system substrate-binding protein
MRINSSRVLIGVAVLAVGAGAVAAAQGAGPVKPQGVLVVDNSFTIKTSDPQRAFDLTAKIVDRPIYDTLFTYNGNDLADPAPMLVSSWKATGDAETFVFQLRKGVHFANGDPLTAADVAFSLERLINLKGNAAFLLNGVTVKAAGKYTVIMNTTTPDSQLPAILAHPSTGIVNSKLLMAHGGTDAADASTTDTAEQWLNSSASVGAGSGPYVLKSFSTTSQVVLAPNTHYWGPNKPTFKSIVIRNMLGPIQLINIQGGHHEIALDLSAAQAASIASNHTLKVALQPSTWIFYLLMNNNPQVSTITSNKQFQQAVRHGLDYKGLLSVAGPGAIQAPGLIPNMFLGSLPQNDAVKQDVAQAKSAFSASKVGGSQVTLEYPSDLTLNGVSLTTLAQKIQANLQAIGINVQLSGSPLSTWLTKFRSGQMPFSIGIWGPDYPDPADYLVFSPGQLRGLSAGWPTGSDPEIESLAAKLLVTTTPSVRKVLYQKFQQLLNERSPFVPLMQPTQAFVATRDLKGALYNSVYAIDVTRVSPK